MAWFESKNSHEWNFIWAAAIHKGCCLTKIQWKVLIWICLPTVAISETHIVIGFTNMAQHVWRPSELWFMNFHLSHVESMLTSSLSCQRGWDPFRNLLMNFDAIRNCIFDNFAIETFRPKQTHRKLNILLPINQIKLNIAITISKTGKSMFSDQVLRQILIKMIAIRETLPSSRRHHPLTSPSHQFGPDPFHF